MTLAYSFSAGKSEFLRDLLWLYERFDLEGLAEARTLPTHPPVIFGLTSPLGILQLSQRTCMQQCPWLVFEGANTHANSGLITTNVQP